MIFRGWQMRYLDNQDKEKELKEMLGLHKKLLSGTGKY